MPQHARRDIARAAVGIDERAVVALGNGVDGEVAPQQVFFQRYRRVGIDDEPAIAAATLALRARKRMLFARVRMQEYREVASHRLEAEVFHLRLRRTHHHPVPVAGRQAEQPVAHRAADEIGLHAGMMPDPERDAELLQQRRESRPRPVQAISPTIVRDDPLTTRLPDAERVPSCSAVATDVAPTGAQRHQLFGICAVGQVKALRLACTRPIRRSLTGRALPLRRQS